MHFTKEELFVKETPDTDRRRWDPKIAKGLKTNVYIGQLKLLAGELAFLNASYTSGENLILVYAGAAGGQHIKALSKLFPDLEMFLYDPSPFAIRETEKLHIIRSRFTDQIAQTWASRKDIHIIFISDVRTSGATSQEHESEVLDNMNMQRRWVEILHPNLRSYSLKFRIPYTIVNRGEQFEYLIGDLLYQPYAKHDSMEMRLIWDSRTSKLGVKLYDSKILEEVLFYHNSIVRPVKNFYTNIFDGTEVEYTDSHFNRSYDDTYFLFVLRKCLSIRTGVTPDEITTLSTARDLITITSNGHWSLKSRKA